MLLNLARSHFGSVSQNITEVKVSNLYLAANPLSLTDISYVTRPSSKIFSPAPVELCRGIYYQQGLLGDDLIIVSGTTVSRVNSSGTSSVVGTIQGTGECQFASTIFGIGIVSGQYFYIYDGITFTDVAIPDGNIPNSITSLNNYFVLSMVGSNKFYWVEPGELIIDGLSFASAEANTDHIVAVKRISDELWIIGTETAETWTPTADINAPFNRVSGRVFEHGCVSALSVSEGIVNSLPCAIWVTQKKEVVIAQGAPSKISDDYVEEVLRSSNTFYGWFFRRNRNDFYVLTTDIATLVYDTSFQSWYRWSNYEQETWKISKGVQKADSVFGISLMTESPVYKLGETAEAGINDWLVCELTGYINHNSKTPLPCNTVDVIAEVGFSQEYLTIPSVEMRWSDDQGSNWSTYQHRSLGDRGNTAQEVQFRSLGMIKTPGRRFEFRFSSSESFRLDYVLINEEG